LNVQVAMTIAFSGHVRIMLDVVRAARKAAKPTPVSLAHSSTHAPMQRYLQRLDKRESEASRPTMALLSMAQASVINLPCQCD
jgi:hypothetical protein